MFLQFSTLQHPLPANFTEKSLFYPFYARIVISSLPNSRTRHKDSISEDSCTMDLHVDAPTEFFFLSFDSSKTQKKSPPNWRIPSGKGHTVRSTFHDRVTARSHESVHNVTVASKFSMANLSPNPAAMEENRFSPFRITFHFSHTQDWMLLQLPQC